MQKKIFARHHCPGTRASNDRAIFPCVQNSRPSFAVEQRFCEIGRETPEQVDQFCIAERGDNLFVVGTRTVNEREGGHIRRAEGFEAAYTVPTSTLMVIVGCGCGRDDANRRIYAARQVDGSQVGFAHCAAELSAAL